ncbi:lysozyme inhibitor LprI family protein, partial [Mesorhizobium japonicum]|uniref:lysozyme inhibitor LprI family protein n=1 Tax=Mesorhizobium japonicum TaxID=2066070 RepID=UPI003B5A4A10
MRPNPGIEINACTPQTFEAKDKELNRVYQTVLKQLDTFQDTGPSTRKLLILAQRKWVEFRNA